jgi:coenzyme F420-0:L-glutamate ligase/coenzyme F420-1:gamma-L-glutamate ligase
MNLRVSPLQGVPSVKPGDNLAKFCQSSLLESNIDLLDGDILVLAQKIVSKAENRFRKLADVTISKHALDLEHKSGKDPALIQLILDESLEILRVREGLIVVEHKLGFVCANAGIDQSNVDREEGWVLLLPENPDKSAAEIRSELQESTGARLGILIIDSHGRAWRNGVAGIAIGLSGMPALVDQRGLPDRSGRSLGITTVGVADELAAAASLMMGQANEGTPIVHVRGFPYPLREGSLTELLREKQDDLFR